MEMVSNKQYCEELEVHYDNTYIDEMHFITQKESALNSILSQSILRVTDYGQLAFLERKWNNSKTCETYEKKYTEFSLNHLSGLFVILSATIVVSGVVLLLETLYERLNLRKKRILEVSDGNEVRIGESWYNTSYQ